MIAAIGYWTCALWLLFVVSPVSVDGGGPDATFYWGSHPPTPSLAEYDATIGSRLPFLYPYWIAASAITFAVALTFYLMRRSGLLLRQVFLRSSAVTCVALLALGALSDIGTSCRFWRGPVFYGAVSEPLPLFKIVAPLSLLAGLLATSEGLRWPSR